jgi:hypothetical protein
MMNSKTLVVLLILLSIIATGAGTVLQNVYESAQIVGFIAGAAFLASAVITGAKRR